MQGLAIGAAHPRSDSRTFRATCSWVFVLALLGFSTGHAAPGDQLFNLTPTDGAAYDSFGIVALSGDTALIGELYADYPGASSGSAYLFDASILHGDHNFDGHVNALDYVTWRDGGSQDHSAAGFYVWRDNFGAEESDVVPEPDAAELLLLLIALTRLASWRWKGASHA